MNLVEVLVASCLVLGSATGSLGIWARTVHSSHEAAALLRQQRQADEQLLAVQAQLQALAAEQRASGAPVPAVCPDLTGLGVEGSGPIVSVSVETGADQRRQRVFDLAAYGLCGGT